MPLSRPVLRLFLLEGPRGGLERLLASFADVRSTPLGLEIPLEDRAPEEILALLLRHGITARATRIVDRPSPVDGPPRDGLVSAFTVPRPEASLAVLQSGLVQDVFSRIADFFGTSRVLVVEKVIRVAVVWVVAWLAYQLVKRVARRIIKAVDDGDDSTMTAAEKRGHTVAQLVRSVGRAVVLVIAVLLTIGQFLPIGPILAAGGIFGLAISFGAQSLVKDVIAGFFILMENQFAVGDVIEAAGKSGTVERMTLRVAVLRDVRGVLHVIPNGQITTVSNLTRSWSRAVIEVGVGYASDVDRAIDVFKDELSRFRADSVWTSRFAGDSEVLGVEDLGEHSVVIRTLLRTVPGAQWDVAREFRRRIKNRLDAEGIEMPYPQRTVHVRHHGVEGDVPAGGL